MTVIVKQYITIETNNPLEARLSENGLKAYMVATLAFVDGVADAAAHYQMSRASVYAAMAFYEENREQIETALRDIEVDIQRVGINGSQAAASFKKKLDQDQS